jgi:hypothetical protein
MSSTIIIGVIRNFFNKFCLKKLQKTCQATIQSQLIKFHVKTNTNRMLELETIAYESTISIFHVKSMTLSGVDKI